MNFIDLLYLIEKTSKKEQVEYDYRKANEYESAQESQILRYNEALRELKNETKSSENDYDEILSNIIEFKRR